MPAFVVYSAPATEPLTVAEVLAHCQIDAQNTEPAPGAITVALASPAAPGNLSAGAYRYRATFVTADGETEGGVVSSAVTVSAPGTNGQIALSAIPLGGALVTARKLYRTAANGSDYLLLATIANNTATTYTDNIADASLGVGVPTSNTTGDGEIQRLIKAARQAAESRLRRYLITQTVDAYLDAFPVWDIEMPPLQSVSSITYVDNNGATQTVDAADYLVDGQSNPARISPAFGKVWPSARWQNNAVRVRFVAGYGNAASVPDCIKQWMLLRIKHFFENRGAISAGSQVEFPFDYVDGLLDSEIVRGYA